MKDEQNNFYVFVIITLVVFFKAIPLGAETQGSEGLKKAQEYYLAGRQFIQQGDYQAANNEFKKAQLLLSPAPISDLTSPPQVRPPKEEKETKDAKASLKLEDVPKDEAVSYYLKAIKQDPQNNNLRYNLALEYIKVNEFKLAQEQLGRIIELDSRDKDAYYNLAVLSESYFNNKKQAIYYYSRYLSLAPEAEDAWRVKMWIKELKKQKAVEK